MTERYLDESEFELATRAADAVMGRDQSLPPNLAGGAEQFVNTNPFFSGLVQVERSGSDVTLVGTNERGSGPDFRFGETVAGELLKNKRTASGQRVKRQQP